MQPQTLLNRMRELEHRRLCHLRPDVRYEHLDSLADPPAGPNSTRMLRVLRSKYAVATAAKELSNCALAYAERVQKRGYVLVAMVDGTGRAKGLAGWSKGGRSWDHHPVEHGNQTASPETKALFDAFLPVLRAWRAPDHPSPTALISVHGIDPKSSDLLARAGVPDLASLAALADSEPRMSEVWRAISEDAEAGQSLKGRVSNNLEQFANEARSLVQ